MSCKKYDRAGHASKAEYESQKLFRAEANIKAGAPLSTA